jgi:hypothetical protein
VQRRHDVAEGHDQDGRRAQPIEFEQPVLRIADTTTFESTHWAPDYIKARALRNSTTTRMTQ